MDLTQTATLNRTSRSQRDPGAHRRAYLDTYAKRRAGISNLKQAEPTKPSSNKQVTLSANQPVVDVKKPAIVAVPTIHSSHAETVTTQEPQAQFTYTPKPTYNQNDQPKQNQKHYLDSLIRHHNERVRSAPAQIETISQPDLTENTEHLIDPDTHKRMEANLEALYSSKPLTDHIAKNKTSASAAHVRTIIASALTCGMLAVAIFSFTGRYDPQPVVAQPIGAPVIEVEAPTQSTPTGAPVASTPLDSPHANPTDPVRIISSSIGLNASVNSIGTTQDGLIAVPKSYTSVGWYSKASTPGQDGPAVLVGHYTGGNGGVFDNLSNIKEGDLVTVKNGNSEVFTYKVTKKAEYERDKVPMNEIFKKGGVSRLEIITCSGKWQSSNYNNRLVVTAALVQ